MRPLEGIKVVELATFVAIPTAGRVLADWGAEVIKIEPLAGEEWRNQGKYDNLPHEDDCNPEFVHTNSGKKLIALDLKKPEGKEIMLRLLEDADVFISNIRWESIVRLGLDYDTLHEKFPRLIYFHFSGFGYEGAGKDRPGYDSAAFWATSGALYEISEKGSHPMYPPTAFGDAATSNTILSGITTALYHRERTGQGLRVTTSLYANGIWCNFTRIIACQERKDGSIAPSFPRVYDEATSPFTNIYQCKDGRWILLATYYNTHFKACLNAFELEEYLNDERFDTDEHWRIHAAELRDLFAEKILKKTAAEWHVILNERDIVHQELKNSSDVTKDEQAWANDYLSRVKFPNGQEYVVPNSPVTFMGMERTPARHVGGAGCDTTEILTQYGYTEEEILKLKANGIASGN